MGIEPKDYARSLIAAEVVGNPASSPTPANDRPGPYQGRGNNNRWGQQLSDMLQAIMNADFDANSSSL